MWTFWGQNDVIGQNVGWDEFCLLETASILISVRFINITLVMQNIIYWLNLDKIGDFR